MYPPLNSSNWLSFSSVDKINRVNDLIMPISKLSKMDRKRVVKGSLLSNKRRTIWFTYDKLIENKRKFLCSCELSALFVAILEGTLQNRKLYLVGKKESLLHNISKFL